MSYKGPNAKAMLSKHASIAFETHRINTPSSSDNTCILPQFSTTLIVDVYDIVYGRFGEIRSAENFWQGVIPDNKPNMANIETDVVIVGGGGKSMIFPPNTLLYIFHIVLIQHIGCGLTLSILLSNYGVSHYLFERHSTTSIIPKAHLINQRSMEIFRQHGIAPLLQAVGGPEHHMSRVSWMSSLGGDGEFHRRRFGSIPAFGASAGPDHETTHRYADSSRA